MTETLIVDGYNVIYADNRLQKELDKSLMEARRALEKSLRDFQAKQKSIKTIFVVYDSRINNQSEIEDLGLVKNIFVSSAGSADEKIVSILKNLKRPERAAVLSKDNFVMNHARAMGVPILSVGTFFKKITKLSKKEEEVDLTHDAKEKINRELKGIWRLY